MTESFLIDNWYPLISLIMSLPFIRLAYKWMAQEFIYSDCSDVETPTGYAVAHILCGLASIFIGGLLGFCWIIMFVLSPLFFILKKEYPKFLEDKKDG